MPLLKLGWADPFESAWNTLQEQDDSLLPARVASAQRGHYQLWTEDRVVMASVSGKLRRQAASDQLPVVGDWVGLRHDPSGGQAVIHALLPRRSALVRKRAGGTSEPQVIAANIDLVFLASSLNQDWNPRRIERALALIWESGAQPILLLTKLDLCPDPGPQLTAAAEVAMGVPVHALSVLDGRGLDALSAYLKPGKTCALIGSSGVGKSSLVNYLCGEARAATREIRAGDERGKHTTTHRELFLLPSGGLLIDTPGMRELGMLDAQTGLDITFQDVEALAGQCRFQDCQHRSEPGCAVQAALSDGSLEPARFDAYVKLQRELAHQARRSDERLRREHHQASKQLSRLQKRRYREDS
jgi:ribosome biogenesis GTPase